MGAVMSPAALVLSVIAVTFSAGVVFPTVKSGAEAMVERTIQDLREDQAVQKSRGAKFVRNCHVVNCVQAD